MMKRNHSIFCALALAACCFLAGCANGETTTQTPPQEPTSTTDTQTTKVSYQLPTVDSVNEKTMTSEAKQLIETIYGVDLTGWEAYYSLTDAAGAGQNDAGISFMGAEGEAPYLAEIDQESKEIISVETAAWKAATPSDIAKQADYVSAAKAFAEEYLKATGLQEAVCYQPVQPISGEVTTNSVYVVFPEMQTYVEVSADEGHALVGYRHFANAQALNDFLQRQGKAF